MPPCFHTHLVSIVGVQKWDGPHHAVMWHNLTSSVCRTRFRMFLLEGNPWSRGSSPFVFEMCPGHTPLAIPPLKKKSKTRPQYPSDGKSGHKSAGVGSCFSHGLYRSTRRPVFQLPPRKSFHGVGRTRGLDRASTLTTLVLLRRPMRKRNAVLRRYSSNNSLRSGISDHFRFLPAENVHLQCPHPAEQAWLSGA